MLTRGELAKLGGVNPETIRYYERNGLLPLPARSESGYRLFSTSDVEYIRFVKRAQAVGFSLAEIKTLLEIKFAPDGTGTEVRDLAQTKIDDIDAKIRSLQAMKRVLLTLTEDCPGDVPASECPILNAFQSDDNLVPLTEIAGG
jgi:Cu(I)-responsive transcriptional regulator